MMSITELQTRYEQYGIESTRAMISYIKDNLEQLNVSGAHAIFEKGKWNIDDEAVSIMDAMLHYEPPKPVLEPETSPEQKEIKILENQIEQLKGQLQTARQEAHEYHTELESVSEQFLQFQQGHENLNSSINRRSQQDAEVLHARLKQLTEQHNKILGMKDDRIKLLEERVADLQNTLSQMNDLHAKSVQVETELLRSRSEQDKLLKDLHGQENKLVSMSDDLNAANEEKSLAVMHNNLIREDVTSSIRTLLNVVEHLKTTVEPVSIDSVGVSAELQEGHAEHAQLKGKEAPGGKMVASKAKSPADSSKKALEKHRETVIEEERKKQKAAAAEKKESKGFFSSFFHKAASFIG